MKAKLYISNDGTADLFAAKESGVTAEELAEAKLEWVVANFETDSTELLNRLLAYARRCEDAKREVKESVLGSDRHLGYKYRAAYYEKLTALMKDDIKVVMEYGHANM